MFSNLMNWINSSSYKGLILITIFIVLALGVSLLAKILYRHSTKDL